MVTRVSLPLRRKLTQKTGKRKRSIHFQPDCTPTERLRAVFAWLFIYGVPCTNTGIH